MWTYPYHGERNQFLFKGEKKKRMQNQTVELSEQDLV